MKFDISHMVVIPCAIAASIMFFIDSEYLAMIWSINCGAWCLLHAMK